MNGIHPNAASAVVTAEQADFFRDTYGETYVRVATTTGMNRRDRRRTARKLGRRRVAAIEALSPEKRREFDAYLNRVRAEQT